MGNTGAHRVHSTGGPHRPLAVDPAERAILGSGARGNRCRCSNRWRRRGAWQGRGQPGGSCRLFVLHHLAHQHIGQADTAALAGQGHRQLLVVHILVLLGRRRIERIVLGQHVGGLAHGLEHFVEKQRLELLRHLAHVGFAVLVADLQLLQAIEVGVRTGVTAGSQAALTNIHG